MATAKQQQSLGCPNSVANSTRSEFEALWRMPLRIWCHRGVVFRYHQHVTAFEGTCTVHLLASRSQATTTNRPYIEHVYPQLNLADYPYIPRSPFYPLACSHFLFTRLSLLIYTSLFFHLSISIAILFGRRPVHSIRQWVFFDR